MWRKNDKYEVCLHVQTSPLGDSPRQCCTACGETRDIWRFICISLELASGSGIHLQNILTVNFKSKTGRTSMFFLFYFYL